jgi:hypothetical protein
MSAEEADEAARMTRDNYRYISTALDAMMDTGITDAQAAAKSRLWFNGSIRPIYNAGLASARKNAMAQWVMGATEEKCDDCIRLSGQVHRFSAWKARGLLPGVGQMTKCAGWMCQCQLKPTKGRARGNW